MMILLLVILKAKKQSVFRKVKRADLSEYTFFVTGNETGLFKIDPVTAAITQLKSVLQENLPDEEFRVVIQVLMK